MDSYQETFKTIMGILWEEKIILIILGHLMQVYCYQYCSKNNYTT